MPHSTAARFAVLLAFAVHASGCSSASHGPSTSRGLQPGNVVGDYSLKSVSGRPLPLALALSHDSDQPSGERRIELRAARLSLAGDRTYLEVSCQDSLTADGDRRRYLVTYTNGRYRIHGDRLYFFAYVTHGGVADSVAVGVEASDLLVVTPLGVHRYAPTALAADRDGC